MAGYSAVKPFGAQIFGNEEEVISVAGNFIEATNKLYTFLPIMEYNP